jgi:ATP/maltotriose-dependent transcriptional regulator MalT/DNA-binding SARP family transcriptional activator
LAFGPEYRPDPLTFSRRFFESFFENFLPGSVLVLDNYQEVPADSPVHDMLREGLSLLPPGVQVLVLSRQPPPGAFARLQANGQLDLLTWDELRMTDREAQALLRARIRQRLKAERISALCRLAAGWPAGLVLVSAEAEHGFVPEMASTARELLFAYFANEVFQESDAELRSLLLQTAVLPSCTSAQAEELTGLKRAGARLQTLARTGYFTVAHGNTDPAYTFHPLFREFLLHQAATAISHENWNSFRSRAAEILERTGQIGEAFELYRAIGATERQIHLIAVHARALLNQGQHQTLLALLKSLPAECVEQQSWLSLWLGLGLVPVDPRQGLVPLERAFATFEREGNLPGQMLAWCSIVDAWCYLADDYSPLDFWIDWLNQHLEMFEPLQDAALIEAISISMTWAVVVRRPDHPDIRMWLRRAERIFEQGSHPQIRLRAGTTASLCRFTMGERVACDSLLRALRQLTEALQEPLALIANCWIEATVLGMSGTERQRCREVIEQGLALGERFGIHLSDFWFHGCAAMIATREGDLETAGRSLGAMERAVRGHDARGFFHFVSGGAAYAGGNLSAALAHAELSLQEAVASGRPSNQLLARLLLADLLFDLGRSGEARAQMRLAEELIGRVHWPMLEFWFHVGAACRALLDPQSGLDPALNHLRRAMVIGREYGFENHHPHWRKPEWLTLACAAALEQGIEIEFVQRMIRAQDLRPAHPPVQCADWPWEIRVATLGRFAIHRNGRQLVFPAKAPKKVLLMLKALIAAGSGGIGEAKLSDWLWPDADGDTARQTLDTTLHRLRQLLGAEGLVTLREGCLALDPYRCWVDAHACEQLLDAGDTSPLALRLYQGEFLDGLDTPWAQRCRERLREKFVKAVLAQGERCEMAADFSGAIAWYERGLEADPLDESLYRRIIVCHHANGSLVEGLRTYERCCRMFKAHLDIAPSQETVRLASTLRD